MKEPTPRLHLGWLPWAVCVGFALIGYVLYARALHAFFLSDDFVLLQALQADGPFSVWTQGARFFRPLTSLSLFGDLRLWGLSPLGFHATGWALHVANALLVASLGARVAAPVLDEPQLRVTPLLAGLFFLAHPSHSEAVAWISSRGDLVVTLFSLVSLLALLSHRQSNRFSALSLVWAALLCALAAKESAVVLPWILLLWWRSGEKVHGRRRGIQWALAVTPVLYVLVRSGFIGSFVGAYGSLVHLDFAPRRLAGPVLSYSVRSLLPPISHEHAIAFAGTVAIVALALVQATRRRSASGEGSFGRSAALSAGSFGIACLPVLNLGASLFDSQGERLLYLPTVFTSLGLALLCQRAFPPRARLLVGAGLAFFMALSTARSSATWGEAGIVAQRLVAGAVDPTVDPGAVLVNLPDNLRGAYVFRNGFDAACALFRQGGQAPTVLVGTALAHIDDAAEVHREGASLRLFLPAARSVRPAIRPNHRSSFVLLADPSRVAVLRKTSRALELALTPEFEIAPLYAFNRGRLERVAGALHPASNFESVRDRAPQ